MPKGRRIPVHVVLASLGLLLALPLVPAEAANDNVRVLVRFQQHPGQAELDAITSKQGVVTRRFKIVPAVAASIPAAAIPQLRGHAAVAAVELDAEIKVHDVEMDAVWGVKRIGSAPVQDGTFAGSGGVAIRGKGIRVAVMDTGIDYTHAQLAANYVGGYDFVNNDADPWDDHYHGTHVAGTIAAVKDGVQIVGVAPGVDLCAVKVLGADGSGSYSLVIAGLDWCINNNVQVVNVSFGSSTDPGSTVKTAFDNAYAAGLIVVASAGNSGEGADTVAYPAKYTSVIAVASTTSSDLRSSFSSTGPAVELAAPGSSIYSTYPGNRYAYLSGTSMAAPHVTGTAALVLAAGIGDMNKDGRRNDDVRRMLQQTAEDLGTTGLDNYYGYGLVDAEYAVTMAYDPNSVSDPAPVPVFNAPSNLAGSVSANQVVLTWLDNSNVEDGFEIQSGVKAKGTTNWSTPQKVGAGTTSFVTTKSNGTYQFRVRAYRVSGTPSTTTWSNQIQLTVGSKR